MTQLKAKSALRTTCSVCSRRQLDPQRALSKISDASKRDGASSGLASIRNALEAGTEAVAKMQERNAYHWVDIRRLCLV